MALDKTGLVLEKEKASKLSKGSSIKVLVKCATCDKERNVVWAKFNKGSVDCFKCACIKRAKIMNKKHPRGKGEKCHNWKGGRIIDKDGYICIYKPEHPYANQGGKKYVFEHRLIVEEHLKRILEPQECVHHINGKIDDNRLENLYLFEDNIKHLNFHNRLRKSLKGFNLQSNLINI